MIYDKPKILIPFLIIVNTLFLFLSLEYPAVGKLKDHLSIYREAVSEDMPSIELSEEGIIFVGNLPYTKVLRNGIIFTIDNGVDTVKLKSFPQKSIWLSNHTFLYRKTSKIVHVPLDSINIEMSGSYTGQDIEHKVDKFFGPIFTIILIFLFAATLLFIFLLILVGAGMGSIVDTFSNGPYGYKQLLKIASLVQLIWIIIAFVCHDLGCASMRSIFPFLLLYIFTIMGVVYFLVRKNSKE